MAELAEAIASLIQARDALHEVRLRILHVRNGQETPADMKVFLESVDADLSNAVDQVIGRAQAGLDSLTFDKLTEDAAKGVAELASIVASARLVSRADVDASSATVRQGLESFAGKVNVREVAAIDKQQAVQLIREFQTDIENRQAWGERISKVVSTAVGIGKTAVKVLA